MEAVIRRLVSIKLLDEFLITLATEKLWFSAQHLFKSGAVNALDILGAAVRASDWNERIWHWDESQ